MKLSGFPISTTDWSTVEPQRYEGEQGHALWRTLFFGQGDSQVRVRLVEYSPGYIADHWCQKGHVILCLEGEMDTHLEDGRVIKLTPGRSYQVADGGEAHKTQTATGVKLFIVD